VENGDDPFHININTFIKAFKDNLSYGNQITTKVSIENLKDPLSIH
jgi:hypothetical protein